MRLYLVRHPKPELADGICYGSTDVRIPSGLETETFIRLCKVLPKHIPVYTSPLSRCANLAMRLADELGSTLPIVDARLTELHFGTWEMRPWNQIAREEIDAWANDLLHYRPGKGEKVLEMAERIVAFYDGLIYTHAKEAAVICHAGTIRLLLARHRGLSAGEMAVQAASIEHRIAYGEVITLTT